MKIRTKLILWSSLILVIMWAVCLVGIDSQRKSHFMFETLRTNIIPGTESMWKISEADAKLSHEITEYIVREGDKNAITALLDYIDGEWIRYKGYEKKLGTDEDLLMSGVDSDLQELKSGVMELIGLKESGASIEALLEKDKIELHPRLSIIVEKMKVHEAICRMELNKYETEIHNSYYSNIKYLYIAAVAVSILTVILGLIMVGSVARPIRLLRDAMLQIGSGRLDQKVEARIGGEIGELVRAFNKMAGELKDSREEIEEWGGVLEEKVAEKTDELVATNEELEAMNAELKQSGDEMLAKNEEMQAMEEELRATNEVMKAKMEELERFQKVTMGREKRVLELKSEIEELKARISTTA